MPLPAILARIRATKEDEIRSLLARAAPAEWERRARSRVRDDPPRPFVAAVATPPPATPRLPRVIAEIKKASPSKGLIRADFAPTALAGAYARGGAAAISCLTDETYFQGRLDHLGLARDACVLPVLRKDFLIHPAQICEARAAGADAILLIARMLDRTALAELHRLAGDLQMDALVEVHDEQDVEAALFAGASLIGVNNRDLDTFRVDPETTYRLRKHIPDRIPVVAESGIETNEQLLRLADAGVAAVLVGESLMRQPDVEAALRRLRGVSA